MVERAAGSEVAGNVVSRKLVMARPASVALSSLYLLPQQGNSAGDQPPPTTRRQHSTIFLGLDALQAPYFAHDVVDAEVASAAVQWMSSECSTATHDTSEKGGSAAVPHAPLAEVEWQSARALALSPEEGALVATAVGVAQVQMKIILRSLILCYTVSKMLSFNISLSFLQDGFEFYWMVNFALFSELLPLQCLDDLDDNVNNCLSPYHPLWFSDGLL